MAILRDYQCNVCPNIFEHWEKEYGEAVFCSYCGGEAFPIISGTSFKLPGHDTGFPTAADKWARTHRKANKRELDSLGIPN